MTNCPNCGAPFTGDKCEYCGTESKKSALSEIGIDAKGIYMRCYDHDIPLEPLSTKHMITSTGITIEVR